MGAYTRWFSSPADGTRLATYRWGPDSPRAIVQIAHGLSEYSLRYEEFAQTLAGAGYLACAVDHRGHGHSVKSQAELGDFGEPGFLGVAADVAAYGAHLAAEFPDVPVFLFGHGVGSFAVQHVILDHSDLYRGVVLSGSTALDVLASQVVARRGAVPTQLIEFNMLRDTEPGHEWLSRDEEEVDRFVDDPLSGFDLPATTLPSLLTNVERLADPEALARIRSDLPILLISGRADVLSGDGQLVALLAQRYRSAGLADVFVQIYSGARHQLFVERNRAQVIEDVVQWLVRYK